MITKQPFYVAYGSNLNKTQMSMRCPDAKPIVSMLLPDYRLVFRGVADIIPAKGWKVPVVLWEITESCEKALDRYEGFPNLYRKEYFDNTKTGDVYMAYVMNGHGLAMPPMGYLNAIRQGYDDFGLDETYIDAALAFTKDYDSNDGHIPKRWKT